MGRIIGKNYYRITFRLVSPLSVGSGINNETDKDIMRNSLGNPFIPGSAVAGVCRELFNDMDKADIKKYFGYVSTEEKEENQSSVIVFYDANIVEKDQKNYHISRRDCVALDEYKTAKKGAKFDMEILEPGVRFVTYVEQNIMSETDVLIADDIMKHWLSGRVCFGSKTMRGYGEIGHVKIEKLSFDFLNKKDVEKWLEFDMYNDTWIGIQKVVSVPEPKKQIELALRQKGGISIRRYTTDISENEDALMPDSEQLTVIQGNEKVPVIPGTTWAGAFLHHMKELFPKLNEKKLFGMISDDEKKKSVIRFSETQLKGGVAKILTRNAIDRFTGGTVTTSLFTEKTYYDGTTVLKISFRNTEVLEEKVKKTLAATIADLHNGFLGIGGLTSIGRGLFCVTAINEKSVGEEDDIYNIVMDILNEVEKKK